MGRQRQLLSVELQRGGAVGRLLPQSLKHPQGGTHHGANDERSVHRKLHVAGTAGLRARRGDVLAAVVKGCGGREGWGL